jgi:ubiquinol oxidase
MPRPFPPLLQRTARPQRVPPPASPSQASSSIKYQVSPLVETINSKVLDTAKFAIDGVYGNRSIARFYALETIARMPYFAYFNVLHLYETMGWFRKSEYLKSHFEENWNELYHLKIMEQLGGDKNTRDRLVAQAAAIAYYWATIVLYMLSPSSAYNLSKQLEEHAYTSYDKFITANEDMLRSQAAPPVALAYYKEALLRTGKGANDNFSQDRAISLYDIFISIRDDEGAHADTMNNLQQVVIEGKKL